MSGGRPVGKKVIPLTPFDEAWFAVFPPISRLSRGEHDIKYDLNLTGYLKEEALFVEKLLEGSVAEENININTPEYKKAHARVRARTRLLTFLGLPDQVRDGVRPSETSFASIAESFGIEGKSKDESSSRFNFRVIRGVAFNLLQVPGSILFNTYKLLMNLPQAMMEVSRRQEKGRPKKQSGAGGSMQKESKRLDIPAVSRSQVVLLEKKYQEYLDKVAEYQIAYKVKVREFKANKQGFDRVEREYKSVSDPMRLSVTSLQKYLFLLKHSLKHSKKVPPALGKIEDKIALASNLSFRMDEAITAIKALKIAQPAPKFDSTGVSSGLTLHSPSEPLAQPDVEERIREQERRLAARPRPILYPKKKKINWISWVKAPFRRP